jgi:NAD(P)-dependent dehydrogenase (short-subunit alcohol dehydrogenase family)
MTTSTDTASADRRHFLTITAAGAAALTASAQAASAQATGPSQGDTAELKREARRDLKLSGKRAVVTGAARGIGRGIAVALASAGADVMGLDIAGPVSPAPQYPPATLDDLRYTGELVQKQGVRWAEVRADIRDLSALRDAADRAKREFGGLDIVVANAGIQTFAPLLEMTDAQWRDVIEVNLTGTANTIRAFAPLLKDSKEGRLIVVASSQGRHAMAEGSSYCASKWGVFGLMKTMAVELGEAQDYGQRDRARADRYAHDPQSVAVQDTRQGSDGQPAEPGTGRAGECGAEQKQRPARAICAAGKHRCRCGLSRLPRCGPDQRHRH